MARQPEPLLEYAREIVQQDDRQEAAWHEIRGMLEDATLEECLAVLAAVLHRAAGRA
jgi:hypothetical protein